MRGIMLKIFNFPLDNIRLLRYIRRSRLSIADVICRSIKAEDKARYINFIGDYFNNNPAEIEKRQSIPECSDGFIYYIALYRQRIVGAAKVRKVQGNGRVFWQVHGIGVLEGLRGYGIGEKLLRSIISAIKEESFIIFLDVFKNNNVAIKLYKKVGFKVTDEREKFQIGDIKFSPENLVMFSQH